VVASEVKPGKTITRTNSMELIQHFMELVDSLPTALLLSLSRARPIQSTPPPRAILILSTQLSLGFPSGLLPSGFPTNNIYAFLFSPFCYMPLPFHPPRLDHLLILDEVYKPRSSSLCSYLHLPATSSLFGQNHDTEIGKRLFENVSQFKW
jgi:hypothetical protein